MTPAETLTAAAAKLRDAATAAIHAGRTTWQQGTTIADKASVLLDHPEEPTVLIQAFAERLEQVNVYLALVGPRTGLVMADWLFSEARVHLASIRAAEQVWPDDEQAQTAWVARQDNPHALAVARALLGEVTS